MTRGFDNSSTNDTFPSPSFYLQPSATVITNPATSSSSSSSLTDASSSTHSTLPSSSTATAAAQPHYVPRRSSRTNAASSSTTLDDSNFNAVDAADEMDIDAGGGGGGGEGVESYHTDWQISFQNLKSITSGMSKPKPSFAKLYRDHMFQGLDHLTDERRNQFTPGK